MDNLSVIDLILLSIIVFISVGGFFSGFMRELFSSIGIIVGFASASRYATDMGHIIQERVFDLGSSSLSAFIGFVLVFFGVWFVFFVIAVIVSRLTKKAFSKYLNALLGVLFGALKGFLILAFVLHLVLKIEFMDKALNYFNEQSWLYPKMSKVASKIVKVDLVRSLPKDENELKQKMDETKDVAIEKMQELKSDLENLHHQKSQE